MATNCRVKCEKAWGSKDFGTYCVLTIQGGMATLKIKFGRKEASKDVNVSFLAGSKRNILRQEGDRIVCRHDAPTTSTRAANTFFYVLNFIEDQDREDFLDHVGDLAKAGRMDSMEEMKNSPWP